MKEVSNPFQQLSEQNEAILNRISSLESLLETRKQEKNNTAEMLTRNEVCERFKISKGLLHKLMRENTLEFIKVGRKTLFDNSIVEAYFQSQKQGKLL